MLARRFIVVSPDPAFARQVTGALAAAGGTVDTFATLDAATGAPAALVIVHLDGDIADVRRLGGDAPVIAILPRSDLVALVDVMQVSERVAGVLVAEPFDAHALAAMATGILAGDDSAIAARLRDGVEVHTRRVGTYDDKTRCIAEVSAFAAAARVRRKYRDAIGQCLDEMLMNALYDAPVDAHGRPLVAGAAARSAVAMRPEQQVVVQYACDGAQFAVAVRDVFGRLERATVLRYLHKCLHQAQQIDRKAGGAGLGLYLMASSATHVSFHVRPGEATEVVCAFDLQASKLRLRGFGFVAEPSAARAARTPPAPRPRPLIGVLLAAIAVTLALIAYVAWR